MKKKKYHADYKKSLNNKAFQVAPIAIVDNIVLSKKEAWAYYKISDKPYTFLSTSAKIDLAQSTIVALGSLCQSADKKVDCHILISNQPFDSRSWERDLIEKYRNYNPSDPNNYAFRKFIGDQADSLYINNYQKRVTYVGVKLMDRGAISDSVLNPLEFGFKDAMKSLREGVKKLFLFEETEIEADEENRVRMLETTVFNSLSNSSLMALRPSAEELLLTTKRRLYPAMPTPYLETDYDSRIGLADIVIESGGEIEEMSRYVKITQICNDMELTGYRATLSFSKFPKDLMFPSSIPPFLHEPSMLPFTVNCRFSLIPTEQMKKNLYKKQQETEDEINNLAESNQRPTESLKETMRDQATLEKDLNEENLPWVIGSYRITVEAPTKDDIKSIVETLKLKYKKHEFVLSWTTGDQLDLLREEFFGGKLLVKDFSQTTNLALLGIAGIDYGGTVGDPVKQVARYS